MEEIVAAVQANPVVVVAGDTGCGKSTQLPQYLIRAVRPFSTSTNQLAIQQDSNKTLASACLLG